MWTRGRLVVEGARRQGDRRRQVLRLLRLRRAVHEAAVAPDPGDVPRREGGGARPHLRPGAGDDRAGRAGRPAACTRAASPARFGVTDRGRPGRQVAERHGALGLAYPDPGLSGRRPADAAVAGGRGRGRPGLRLEPARPAAGRAGRHPRHDGPRPGLPDRRQGRRRRRDRQGASPPTRSTRTCRSNKWDESIAKLAALAAEAQRRADRDRQRHRVAGDRQARRRPAQAVPGAQGDQGDGVRGRRVGLLGLRVRLAGTARHGRLAARRRLDRPPPAGPAGRTGEDRPEVDRRRAVPARSRRRRSCPARSTASSRTA